jgi:predicted PurR-regulated permease PerM
MSLEVDTRTHDNKQQVSVVTYRINLQTWLALLALGLMIWLIISQAALILELSWILLGAVLLSQAISPLANKMGRWHIPRSLTVIGVYIFALAILGLIGNRIVPIIGSEVIQLQQNAPQLWQRIQTQLAGTPLAQWIPSTTSLGQNISQQLTTLVSTALGTVAGLGGLILDGLVLVILTLFFTTEMGWGSRLIQNWTPPNYRERVQLIVSGIRNRLGRWVWAQIGIGVYFALVFSLALTLLQVPFALTIGIIGGILEVIPYLGGIVALILGILSALTINPLLAIWVIAIYVVVSTVEGHIIAPLLYGRALGLRSAVVLVALFVGGKAAGVVGIFFAVPVAVILTAIVQEVQAEIYKNEAA